MPLSRSAVQELYTRGIDGYSSFINGVPVSARDSGGTPNARQLLRPGLRVLDAGCGFGMTTFAFPGSTAGKEFQLQRALMIDLTPAMLRRFEKELEGPRDYPNPPLGKPTYSLLKCSRLHGPTMIWSCRLRCSSIFRKQDLPRALAGLRARLLPRNGQYSGYHHEEDPGNKSSRRVVVACRTLHVRTNC